MAERLKAAVLKTVKCKASWVRILPPPPHQKIRRRNGRVAEGARLLSEYGCYSPSRVRISLSPPYLRFCQFWKNCVQSLALLKSRFARKGLNLQQFATLRVGKKKSKGMVLSVGFASIYSHLYYNLMLCQSTRG